MGKDVLTQRMPEPIICHGLLNAIMQIRHERIPVRAHHDHMHATKRESQCTCRNG